MMPYREKSAWISVSTHAVVFGAYFAAFAYFWGKPDHEPIGVAMLFAAVLALVAIAASLQIVTAIATPKEANAPADEREQLIGLKAERIASYALSAGVVCLIGALLVGWDGHLVANLLLGALVVSELVKGVAQIVYFRASV